ncbi:MAG: DNA primase [Actinomycetales bacterium]
MNKIPSHIIDEIMQTARIEEVIGSFVNLKRAGSNLKGLSPFTDEKTPAFIVSPAKQIFTCFSTGKGGTVVSFLMEKEHFSYPEALKWLANKYNITIPVERESTAEELAILNERDSLYIINDFARNYFVNQMNESDEGKAIGLSYFEERGFRKDIIEKFQLGYCLNKGNDFTKAALEKGYKIEYLEKVGLVKTKDDRHFDFFRGRVMFPIHSVSGRVLGFGGRSLLNDKKIAKYFNSPESLIYNKSEILYGLYFAKGDIIKYDNCFLCEGYTDVISLYQVGLTNVVASSGTSLTKDQIKLIRRYTQNITILYDGDSAGIKASFRGIDLILEEGMNVKVVLFPDGEDPDSFAKNNSTSELESYVSKNTQDFISFKAAILLGESNDDPLKKAELIKDIIHSVSLIPNSITRSVYIQKISTLFGIEETIISNEVLKRRRSALSNQLNAPELKEITIEKSEGHKKQSITTFEKKQNNFHEFELLRLMLKYGTLEIASTVADTEIATSIIEFICHEITRDELSFENELYAKIFSIFLDGLSEKTLYTTSYFKRLEDQEIVQLVSDIESTEYEISPMWLSKYKIEVRTELDYLYEVATEAIYHFKTKIIDQKIKAIQLELLKNESLNEEEMLFLLEEQMNYQRVKKVFTDKLGRIITE